MKEKLTGTLQENLLTLLAHDDSAGKIVAGMVSVELFEGEYRVVAERAIDYWQRHGQAPKVHASDLVADILEDRNNRKAKTYQRILLAMLQLYEGINTEYVLSQLRTFSRMQHFKSAILDAAEKLNRDGHSAVEAVEEIFADVLRVREVSFEKGMTLLEHDKMLANLQNRVTEFTTGIKQLDSKGIVPQRGTAMLFLGATGRGKTWWLVNLGKSAILQRKRVLHISLEMSEEQVAQRYYQALYAATKRPEEEVKLTQFEFDRFDRLESVTQEDHDAPFALMADNASKELSQRAKVFGKRLANVIIKRFPPRMLTTNGLRAFLDNLEIVEGFIPDLLILDYIGIMKTDADNHRITLGRAFEEFRAICVERNVAGATASQISREGANAAKANTTHVSEDWSLIGTADIALTLSATDAEFNHGLARLSVDKARDERDKFSLLITQNYSTGQFCLDSIFMRDRYSELLEQLPENDTTDQADLYDRDKDKADDTKRQRRGRRD